MAKAHGITWLLLGAAAPVIAMGVLYSRVVYSLWIKRDGRNNGSQKVRIKRNIKFSCGKTDYRVTLAAHFNNKRALSTLKTV